MFGLSWAAQHASGATATPRLPLLGLKRARRSRASVTELNKADHGEPGMNM
jgi:hypothetical protein